MKKQRKKVKDSVPLSKVPCVHGTLRWAYFIFFVNFSFNNASSFPDKPISFKKYFSMFAGLSWNDRSILKIYERI
jgi:hypothetical protein